MKKTKVRKAAVTLCMVAAPFAFVQAASFVFGQAVKINLKLH